MNKNNRHFKLHIYNKLFSKIFLYYILMILLFAVLISSIFIETYSENTMKVFYKQQISQARNISSQVKEYIINNDTDTYTVYLNIIDSNFSSDIWIISNPDAKNPMGTEWENTILVSDTLQSSVKKVLKAAFNGKEAKTSNFNAIYDITMLTVGVPIKLSENEEAIGAVLVNSEIEGQKVIIRTNKMLIIVSVMVSLVLSFFIAFIFAKKLAKPISQMRMTANGLAEGNYNLHTNINRVDEIGELANSIDILANRLETAKKERENMEQMRRDFFANVSHELRTPITVVRAYAETLIDGIITDKEKIFQYYGRILSECKGMERLVGDLLLLSKMDNPDFKIEKEPINIVQVFNDIIRNAMELSKIKNIEIIFNSDKDIYMILGDYDRLRQMFMIIFDNAIKFSKEFSKVYINLSGEDKIKISIKDEGVGISKEELPHIFDKFYKSKLRQNAKGSGLGLAIAQKICIKHNGNIEVFSQKDKGTEFIFKFDCYKEENKSKL